MERKSMSANSKVPRLRCMGNVRLAYAGSSPISLVVFVDGADVRVVQCGRGFGFALETAEGLRIAGEFVGQELQGDVAAQLQVFRLVDHTHTAATDLAEDAVMGNRLPHGLGGRGHWLDMLGRCEG
jgi:hypothetical protein